MKKPAYFNCWPVVFSLLAFCGHLLPGQAEPVRNGNEMALSYATNSASGKIAFSKSVIGIFHAFRYLEITEIKLDVPREGAAVLIAVEPSSSLRIKMIVTAPLSVEKARNLRVGECVAGRGRVKSLGAEEKDLLVLDPAIISHKDREVPKMSKELLRDVAPDAY